jgi:hypothetical protein
LLWALVWNVNVYFSILSLFLKFLQVLPLLKDFWNRIQHRFIDLNKTNVYLYFNYTQHLKGTVNISFKFQKYTIMVPRRLFGDWNSRKTTLVLNNTRSHFSWYHVYSSNCWTKKNPAIEIHLQYAVHYFKGRGRQKNTVFLKIRIQNQVTDDPLN